jgi:ribose transport system ATP-binding protein
MTQEATVTADVSETTTPRLRVDAVSKTFGRNRALRDVSLEVRPGELHGLIGPNGSGKSTLAKVLTGLYAPDRGGRVEVDGHPLRLPVRPKESRDRGVAVVHQSLGLVPEFSVLENLRVGRLRAGRLTRRIDWQREREEAHAVLARLGRELPLDAPVHGLAEEDRATLAIARALQDAHSGRGLIIFDESTRALTRQTLEHFYEIIDGVVRSGTSVLLIAHHLGEVLDAADRVTVLRDGEVVHGGVDTAGLSEADLAQMVVGRDLGGGRRQPPPADTGREPVRLEAVTGRQVRDVSLALRPGEVVGVTGLADSGYDELPYLISGARGAAGSIILDGRPHDLAGLTPARALGLGIALVPEGREAAGLAMDQTVAENALLPQTASRRQRLLPLGRRSEAELVEEWSERLDVRPRDPRLPVGKLSGGNQQKVVLAKWLAMEPRLLVLHEPTQAVDVGARQVIVDAVRRAAAEGRAVLVAGSDENELTLLCDRILIFREGAVAGELGPEATPDDVVTATFSTGSKKSLRPPRA